MPTNSSLDLQRFYPDELEIVSIEEDLDEIRLHMLSRSKSFCCPKCGEELRKLHAGKTGALFIAAVRSGARLSGAASDELLALTKFADLLGLAFQITDDILDVEGDAAQMGKAAHSDEKKHKSTYVTLYTLEGAKALAQKTVDEALGCLEMFGENAEALREITKMMCGRKS